MTNISNITRLWIVITCLTLTCQGGNLYEFPPDYLEFPRFPPNRRKSLKIFFRLPCNLQFVHLNSSAVCPSKKSKTVDLFIILGYGSQNNPLLLFSTTTDIRFVNTTRPSNGNKIKTTTLVKNYTYIAAVDFHFEQHKICWVDHKLEAIQCLKLNGVEPEDKVKIVERVLSPDGLACDWFTNKVYWTDSETNKIEVATMEGEHRKVLFWTDLDQPRAIAIAPMNGLMFWTDWGELPKIERAGMNGDPKTRKVIVSDNIFWPNGLTIDYENQLIYWVDGKLLFIKVMDFDGKNLTKVLSSGLEYPFSLTQFQNKLFWTDWKSMSIHCLDKSTSLKPTELVHLNQGQELMDVHVWDKARQPIKSHPCEHNNGGCSHLCLLAPEAPGFSCACPIGIKLVDNYSCANSSEEMLLLARRTDLCLIYLDSPDYTYEVLPLTDVKYSIAVDYDPVDNLIYWSDDEVKKIQRANLNGSNQEEVITSEIKDPDGIVIDWIGRNIYWTDTGTDRIEVARLDGEWHYRRVVVFTDLVDPRGIAVAPELGWLFWSDWNEKNPKVERSNLDGTEREVIVKDNLGWPNGITLDLKHERIYWCDAKKDKIEYSNMDGTNRRELINDNVPHVFGFSLMGDYIYWTDWQRRTIDRAHKESGALREIIVDQMENVMGLKAIKLGKPKGTNPCKINNGDCSQLCYYRHDKTRVCACEIEFELMADRKTCVKPEAFLLYTKKDSIGRIGIENIDNQVTVPISGIKQASTIDFDITTNRIYFSDTKLHTITRSYLNGSDPQKLLDLGLASPEGVAIDWLGLNIYWTDPIAHRIEVARLMGTSRRTLLWGEIYEPHGLVLDPQKGYMYWSEWGGENCIKKSYMDGTNVIKLTSTTSNALSLTLDYENSRLYWIESAISTIMSTDLDGNDKKPIFKHANFEPATIAIHKTNLYFTDNLQKHVYTINKLTGEGIEKVQKDLGGNVTSLIVFNEKKQKSSNQCKVSNGGCEHLCLSLPSEGKEDRYTCACPTHYTLKEHKECIPPTTFMIYAQRNLAVRLLPDTTDCPEAVLPIPNLKSVKAIDYDPKHNTLYWIETKTHSIKRSETTPSQFNPTNQNTIVVPPNEDVNPLDLAIDPIGRLLFWTCGVQGLINITRLDSTLYFGNLERKDGERPKLLAMHVKKRLLFYTDSGVKQQLIRVRLDGSNRLVIVKGVDITAIAVDSENDIVVWAQGSRIFKSNLDGDNIEIILNESQSKIAQLTIHSGWLYWIDRELHQLQRFELTHAQSRTTMPIQATNIIDLISVKKLEPHPCLSQIKKCTHFCLLNHTQPLCACPSNNILQEDRRSCMNMPNCGKERFTCTISNSDTKDCIPINWRCDQQKDCKDGSDEIDCPNCLANQFKCQDGQCIDQSMVCDNINHCTDKSDEKNCCKNGFQCPQTDVCLDHSLVCDGFQNCADGSDEHQTLCDMKSFNNKKNASAVVFGVLGIVIIFGLLVVVFYLKKRKGAANSVMGNSEDDSSGPMYPNISAAKQKGNNGFSGNKQRIVKGTVPDLLRMSMLNDSGSSTYERRHITGASSSSNNTNNSSIGCYPRETLNPPPSPATTNASTTRNSSPSWRYRPYKHYRSINQPPPPTPCSTDVAEEESDYNWRNGTYDMAPPPTPTGERRRGDNSPCPPSPGGSQRSSYFSPLPPPPSPVGGGSAQREEYDS